MSRRFRVIPMHPGTLLGEEELEEIIGGYFHALGEFGGQRCSSDTAPEDSTPIYLLVATGGSEQVILEWWAKRRGTPA
ncbi:MAG: hypothetical protein IFK92_07360, partial [Acidobacteria bacterium]|nr:hypothetical protein [Candidatus Sulfomarinibacter kjeldsenii]